MWKKRLKIASWFVLGFCTVALLVAAIEVQKNKRCSDIQVQIKGADKHAFIDRQDVLQLIKENHGEVNTSVQEINLQQIESILVKNAWIQQAELFFDNQNRLIVNITERQPVARIFTIAGNSFYIDSNCLRLPLSTKLSARVPMFTSFPDYQKRMAAPDSALLRDVKTLAAYIAADSFFNAQVAQVNITPNRKFEIIPLVGNQLIKIGDAESLDEKFQKLFAFYKQVWAKAGFEKYSVLDVRFNGQLVATKRGVGNSLIDTSAAMQLFQQSEKELQTLLNDSTYAATTIVKTTVVKKDSAVQKTKPAAAIKANDNKNKVVVKSKQAPAKKTTQPAKNKQQPKAVLKKPKQ